MDHRKIFKDIKAGGFRGVYLFFGDEQFIKEEALNQTIETLIESQFMDLNCSILEGSQVNLEDIINACETLPFMAEIRLVIIKDLPILYGRSGNEIDEEGLMKYMQGMSESTCLILYCRENIDKRKRIYKFINKSGKALEFQHLKGKDLYTWVGQTIKRQGKEIASRDIGHLIDMVGNNLEDLSNEIKKLISYVGENKTIKSQSIDEVVVPTLEQGIFQLVDALGEKRAEEALVVLGNLMYERGEAIQPILAMIARQFRLILQCKLLHSVGFSNQSIGRKLKQRDFVVRKCLAQGRNFSIEQLKEGLNLCLRIDYEIKTGYIQDTLGLELITVKMCS